MLRNLNADTVFMIHIKDTHEIEPGSLCLPRLACSFEGFGVFAIQDCEDPCRHLEITVVQCIRTVAFFIWCVFLQIFSHLL